MTEEFFDQRERDMLDYFRNNFTDPIDRGNTITETFTATAGQTEFNLRNTLVKNIADTITVDATTKRKGYHYTVDYGEGNETTTVTFNSAMIGGETVEITYYYGSSVIEREFSRDDSALPRVIFYFLTGTEQVAALGDYMNANGNGEKGSYHNASYRIEVRDRYASRARRLVSQLFNVPKKMRHANLFRVNIVLASDMQNFDFDKDKEAYIWQFNLDIQWEIMFE